MTQFVRIYIRNFSMPDLGRAIQGTSCATTITSLMHLLVRTSQGIHTTSGILRVVEAAIATKPARPNACLQIDINQALLPTGICSD